MNQACNSQSGYYIVPLAYMRRSEKLTHLSCVGTVQFHLKTVWTGSTVRLWGAGPVNITMIDEHGALLLTGFPEKCWLENFWVLHQRITLDMLANRAASISQPDSQSISQPIRWEDKWKMWVSGMIPGGAERVPTCCALNTGSVTPKVSSFTTVQLGEVFSDLLVRELIDFR